MTKKDIKDIMKIADEKMLQNLFKHLEDIEHGPFTVRSRFIYTDGQNRGYRFSPIEFDVLRALTYRELLKKVKEEKDEERKSQSGSTTDGGEGSL